MIILIIYVEGISFLQSKSYAPPFLRHLVSLPFSSRFAPQHLDKLSHNLELPLVRAGEDDRLGVGGYRLQDDAGVPPGIALLGLHALVAFDGVALSGLWVGSVTKLDEHGLALACAGDRGCEEAVRAVGNW